MGNKDIREQFTPLDLRVADWVSQNYGLTVDEVLLSAKLGVSNEQLIQAKQSGRNSTKHDTAELSNTKQNKTLSDKKDERSVSK